MLQEIVDIGFDFLEASDEVVHASLSMANVSIPAARR
jgi:hypothetical protein